MRGEQSSQPDRGVVTREDPPPEPQEARTYHEEVFSIFSRGTEGADVGVEAVMQGGPCPHPPPKKTQKKEEKKIKLSIFIVIKFVISWLVKVSNLPSLEIRVVLQI